MAPSRKESTAPRAVATRVLTIPGGARFEKLMDFAVEHPFFVTPAGISAHDAAPELHCCRVPQIFRNFPATGEAIQDDGHRRTPYAETPMRAGYEEFRHPVIGGWFSGALR